MSTIDKKFIGADQVDAAKILMENNTFIRIKDSEGAEIPVLGLNDSDMLQLNGVNGNDINISSFGVAEGNAGNINFISGDGDVNGGNIYIKAGAGGTGDDGSVAIESQSFIFMQKANGMPAALLFPSNSGEANLVLSVPDDLEDFRAVTLPGDAPQEGHLIQTNAGGEWSYVDPKELTGPSMAYVAAALTSNINLESAAAQIDQVTLNNGDLVLAAGQSGGGAANGVYVFNGAGQPMTRAEGWAAAEDFVYGRQIYVKDGQANGHKTFMVNGDVETLDTDPISFTVVAFDPNYLTGLTALAPRQVGFSSIGSGSNYFSGVYTQRLHGGIPGNVAAFGYMSPGESPTGAAANGIRATAAGVPLVLNHTANKILLEATEIDVNSNKITNLANPEADQDAATKLYVDAQAQGLGLRKAVRVATVAALVATYDNGEAGVGATLTADANGALSIDDVELAQEDRVLVKDQAVAAHNGIYIVTATGDASNPYVLTRSDDYDGTPATEISDGSFCFVQEGTANASKGYVQITFKEGDVVGTDDIEWTQFSAAAQISAGEGLVQNGNAFDVNVDDSTLHIESNVLQVKDDGLDGSKILFSNNQALRFMNGAGNAEVDVLLLDSNNQIYLTGTTNISGGNLNVSGTLGVSGDTAGLTSIVLSKNVTAPDGQIHDGNLQGFSGSGIAIWTQNMGGANATPTKNIAVMTGNKTDGTGDSGSIMLKTGTSAGGNRGNIILDALKVDLTSADELDLTGVTVTGLTVTQQIKEQIVLDATAVANQYVTLAHTPIAGTVSLKAGRIEQYEDIEWEIDETNADQINFLGGLATGGASELEEGDILVITYSY